ncbi:MAG: hypothetical protein RL477_709 [Pseudomonadota bacterium]|jgi:oxygen-independent coproporphyrinogen-3 oxidase
MLVTQEKLPQQEFDGRLIGRFNEVGPYYSSYPSLNRWKEGLGSAQYMQALKDFFAGDPQAPIYLYAHIPYCAKLCWYCICNIHISNNRERIQRFTDVLCREADNLASFFRENGIRPNVREIHLGGGTPSHLDHAQLRQLVDRLATIADIDALDEFAMEIDPRTVTQDDLRFYHSLGVDRISFGVQDFDPTVQEKINRIQPFEMVRDLLSPDIRALFKGVNFDLLYGLPMQTRETFRRTIELTRELAPDRITLIKYAHVPDVRKHMKMIDADELPDRDTLPLMFQQAVEGLIGAGYIWAGIDNFAKATDDLGKAAAGGRAGRNFSGSSPGRADNIIGLGPTSTNAFGRYYYQALYDLNEYTKAVNDGQFPVFKGYELNAEDRLRREVIMRIQCRQRVDFDEIGKKYGVDFESHFTRELEGLKRFIDDGMVERDGRSFHLTPLGRFFTPHVCRLFDAFLARDPVYKIHGP